VAKGILHPDDALQAVANGADGIVVSNHGGRQTDGTVTSAEALPSVVRAVRALDNRDKPVLVLADTGVRTSVDVLRILALGADGVMMGRPPLFALSVDGAEGVEKMFKTLREDIECDMRCIGWEHVASVPPGVVYQKSW